ncbi:MAG: NAD(P)-dependent alcohol dehydrogenase [Planctomycetota bacterium]
MTTVQAFAAHAADQPFEPFEYELPDELGHDEVEIEVISAGICHSDLSMKLNEWGMTAYPFVGGHENVGRVVRVGDHVPNLEAGDIVGLGWFSRTCMHCDQCMGGDHNRCLTGEGTILGRHGGFADKVRCHWSCAIPIPDGLDPLKVGPMFCGGVTAFTPFIQHNINAISRVGVIGIGGIGHMALMFGKGFGAETTAFTTSESKADEARQLGADEVVILKDPDALTKVAGKFDMILNTANADLDWDAYLAALAPGGVLHTIGAVPGGFGVKQVFPMLLGHKSLSGSPVGPPVRIRRMLEFCARHGIEPVTENFAMDDINDAFELLHHGKPRYRVVMKR